MTDHVNIEDHDSKDRWEFVVEAEGAGPPAVVRVRRLLKAAIRAYGLRCVSVAEQTQSKAKDTVAE
jgi:hypothetical protein